MPRGQWVRSPKTSKQKIPIGVQARTEQRLLEYAKAHLAGRYTRLEIRFRGAFCYVDAYEEPKIPDNFPPKEWAETREEMIERLRATPLHLCRLRYFGDENRWGFAFYTYSNERYELCMFPSGDFYGTPEDALQASSIYLE